MVSGWWRSLQEREGEAYMRTSTTNSDETNASLWEESCACRGKRPKLNSFTEQKFLWQKI